MRAAAQLSKQISQVITVILSDDAALNFHALNSVLEMTADILSLSQSSNWKQNVVIVLKPPQNVSLSEINFTLFD